MVGVLEMSPKVYLCGLPAVQGLLGHPQSLPKGPFCVYITGEPSVRDDHQIQTPDTLITYGSDIRTFLLRNSLGLMQAATTGDEVVTTEFFEKDRHNQTVTLRLDRDRSVIDQLRHWTFMMKFFPTFYPMFGDQL